MGDTQDQEWTNPTGLDCARADGARSDGKGLAPALLEQRLLDSAPSCGSPLPPTPRSHRYRVRLMRFDRPETRTVTLRCEGEAVARSRVAREVGPEWRVVGVLLV